MRVTKKQKVWLAMKDLRNASIAGRLEHRDQRVPEEVELWLGVLKQAMFDIGVERDNSGAMFGQVNSTGFFENGDFAKIAEALLLNPDFVIRTLKHYQLLGGDNVHKNATRNHPTNG